MSDSMFPISLIGDEFGNMTCERKLIEIRKICLDLDTMITKHPDQWLGSLQWLTGQIMCVAKYGEGYESSDLPKTHIQTRYTPL